MLYYSIPWWSTGSEIKQAPHHLMLPSIFCKTQLMSNQAQRGQITVVTEGPRTHTYGQFRASIQPGEGPDLEFVPAPSTTEAPDSRQTQMWSNHHLWMLNKPGQ